MALKKRRFSPSPGAQFQFQRVSSGVQETRIQCSQGFQPGAAAAHAAVPPPRPAASVVNLLCYTRTAGRRSPEQCRGHRSLSPHPERPARSATPASPGGSGDAVAERAASRFVPGG